MNNPSAVPFTKVKVGFKVDPKLASQLKAAGAVVQRRDEVKIEERHMEAGGKDIGRGVVDTGTPVFGLKGIGNVALHEIIDDLTMAGYGLEGTSLYPKGEDYVFQMWFAPGGAAEITSEEAGNLIAEMFARSCHVAVWDNRGSYETATINAGKGGPLNAKTRVLRMSPDGTFSLESPTQAPVVETKSDDDSQPSVLEGLV